jgi:cytochrome oxidase Cu insertion factor (SCO1/SenC/PrrC family)
VQSFPPFQLEDADGRIVTEQDLIGHPAVVYLGRHPG